MINLLHHLVIVNPPTTKHVHKQHPQNSYRWNQKNTCAKYWNYKSNQNHHHHYHRHNSINSFPTTPYILGADSSTVSSKPISLPTFYLNLKKQFWGPTISAVIIWKYKMLLCQTLVRDIFSGRDQQILQFVFFRTVRWRQLCFCVFCSSCRYCIL